MHVRGKNKLYFVKAKHAFKHLEKRCLVCPNPFKQLHKGYTGLSAAFFEESMCLRRFANLYEYKN